VLATTAGIVFEGIGALHEHSPPRVGIMLVVAILALFVNGLSAWLLHDSLGHSHDHGHAHDADNPDDHAGKPHAAHGKAKGHALNLRGAWLHLLGDALGAVALILLAGSLRLLRDAVLVLLEASPKHLQVASIRSVIAAFPGVVDFHDL